MRKSILVLASVAVAMVVLGGVALAANIQCPNGGTNNTGFRFCSGTNSADTMRGTAKKDSMLGKAGGDTMRGYGKHDIIYGNSGNDSIEGGAQFDGILGQEGNDTIKGQDSQDSLVGGTGADKVYGGNGTDDVVGYSITRDRSGRVTGFPDSSSDYLYGGSEFDNIRGGFAQGGIDRIYGGDGPDRIHVSQRIYQDPEDFLCCPPVTQEIVDCGPGDDTVWFDEGVDIVNGTCERRFPQ